MVSVEIRKPFENQQDRGIERHLSKYSLFDYNYNTYVNKGMELEIPVLDSMFPSLYNGIRRGRNYSYDLTCPRSVFEQTDFYESPHSSSDINVIPIKVEYATETYQDDGSFRLKHLNGSQIKTESNKTDLPLLSSDGWPRLIDFVSSYPSAYVQSQLQEDHQTLRNKNTLDSEKRTGSPKTLTEKVNESVGVDYFPSFDSKHNIWKYSTENDFHDKGLDVWKSVPVHHMKSSHTPIYNGKPNSNNNSSGKKETYDSAHGSTVKFTTPDEEMDFLSMKCTSNPSVNSVSLQSLVDETAEIEFDENEINYPPSYPIYDVLKVKLAPENRTIDYIKGDGNCFFRALSKALYGSEKYHKTVRSLVVDIVATNKVKFAPFVDKEDVQEHVKRMAEDHCWATTCEIYAAATLLQRDVFMLTPDHRNENYSWLLFKPVFTVEEISTNLTNHRCYMTLCNTNGNHYDRVAPDQGGCNCFLPQPVLGEVGAL